MISNKRIWLAALTLTGLLLLTMPGSGQVRNNPTNVMSDPAVQMITGPYTHNNLAVFLLHGKEALPDKHFITLGEALARKKVVVYETSEVNELIVENLSNEEIYIQSGDIVKGGKQDRTLGYDLLLPPKSGKVKIASFCVEHGRWQARDREAAGEFNSSEQRLPGKQLKIATVQKKDQQEVWRNVEIVQNKLSANLNTSVNSPQSASSLQLSLENQKVKASVDEYVRALSSVVDGKQDIIGFAFAINGAVNSAEVYASHGLFLKMWPKLLKASAVEALSELRNVQYQLPTPGMVKASMQDAEKGKRSEKAVSSRMHMVTNESELNILVETQDKNNKGQWIHKSYIQK